MSVLGRKMFKDPSNRGARNMLKGMGGIMSSSPELANAVQGYSNAGQVTIADENARMMAELARAYKASTEKYNSPFSIDTYGVHLKNVEGEPIGPNLYTDQAKKFGEFPIDFLFYTGYYQ